MVSINFPAWVTDDTEIPPGFLVRAKRLIYTFVAIEKLRVLHNAGWKWHKGETLTPEEEAVQANRRIARLVETELILSGKRK